MPHTDNNGAAGLLTAERLTELAATPEPIDTGFTPLSADRLAELATPAEDAPQAAPFTMTAERLQELARAPADPEGAPEAISAERLTELSQEAAPAEPSAALQRFRQRLGDRDEEDVALLPEPAVAAAVAPVEAQERRVGFRRSLRESKATAAFATTGIQEAIDRLQNKLRTETNSGKRERISELIVRNIERLRLNAANEAKIGRALTVAKATIPAFIGATGLVSGVTGGLSDKLLDLVEKETGFVVVPETPTEEFVANATRMFGFLIAAKGIAPGVKFITSKLGVKGLAEFMLVSTGTVGTLAGINNLVLLSRDMITKKEAAANMAVSIAGSMVSVIPATFIAPGLANFFGQVGADFTFDVITDLGIRGRLKNQSFADWFLKEEVAQIGGGLYGALHGLSNRKVLAGQQRIIRGDIEKVLNKLGLRAKIRKDVKEYTEEKGAKATEELDAFLSEISNELDAMLKQRALDAGEESGRFQAEVREIGLERLAPLTKEETEAANVADAVIKQRLIDERPINELDAMLKARSQAAAERQGRPDAEIREPVPESKIQDEMEARGPTDDPQLPARTTTSAVSSLKQGPLPEDVQRNAEVEKFRTDSKALRDELVRVSKNPMKEIRVIAEALKVDTSGSMTALSKRISDRLNENADALKSIEDLPEFQNNPAFIRMFGAFGGEPDAIIRFRQEGVIDPETRSEAVRVEEMFDKADKDTQALHDKAAKKLFTTLTKMTIDRDAVVREKLVKNSAGRRALQAKDLAANAFAESGRQVEVSVGKIYKHLPRRHRATLGKFLQAIRTIEVEAASIEKLVDLGVKVEDRMRADGISEADIKVQLDKLLGPDSILKNPSGIKAKEMSSWLDEVRQSDPEVYSKLIDSSEEFWGVMKQQVDQLEGAGIITTELGDYLRETHRYYSPRLFLDQMDNIVRTVNDKGNPIDVPDSGIESLGKGSEGSLIADWEFNMQHVVGRTQNRIFKNRANLELANVLRSEEDNVLGGRVLTRQEVELNRKGEFDIPKDMRVISAWEGGEEVKMMIPTEIAASWSNMDPELRTSTLKFLGVLSGTPIVKALATGINPAFAVANVPVDMAMTWFVTKEYSPIMPVAWVQQVADMVKVAKDVKNTTGGAKEYIQQGGGTTFLTQQGQVGAPNVPSKAVRSQIEKDLLRAQAALGWIPQYSERLMRVALRDRAMQSGASGEQATFIALNYLNFAKGGTVTKTIDRISPYLNASVQGTRSIIRAFKENPKLAMFKAAQVVAFNFGIAYWNRIINEEAWEAVSDEDKVRQTVITTPVKVRDEDGEMRYFYIRIKKDPGQQVFGAIGNELAEAALTGKGDFYRVAWAAKEGFPINANKFLPPTLKLALTYLHNRDFWNNEDVWKGRAVEPQEEYWNQTPKPFVLWGQMTGLSPERSRAAFKTVAPNNTYSRIVGGLVKSVLPDSEEVHKSVAEAMASAPIVNRVFRRTPSQVLSPVQAEDAKRLQVSTVKENGESKNKKRLLKEIDNAKRKLGSFRQQQDRKLDRFIRERKFQQALDFVFEGNDPSENRRLKQRLKRVHPEVQF